MLSIPMIDREGHTFEQEAIPKWLERHAVCPQGREPLVTDGVFFNRALKEEIPEWVACPTRSSTIYPAHTSYLTATPNFARWI